MQNMMSLFALVILAHSCVWLVFRYPWSVSACICIPLYVHGLGFIFLNCCNNNGNDCCEYSIGLIPFGALLPFVLLCTSEASDELIVAYS